MRIVTWNVDGLRAMLARRKEPLQVVLRRLNADIICLQETKFNRTDMKDIQDFTHVPGWTSFLGLCRLRQSYAGVVTFCKEEYTPVAAEEGLARRGGEKANSDSIGSLNPAEWQSLGAEELVHNDEEGRCMITDHTDFVLFHIYGPAVTDIHAERFPRKLTFYKALQLRCQGFLKQGRRVIILGDLNIASRPEDQYRLANSRMPREKLLEDFFVDRPDRQWFRDFMAKHGVVDLLRHFHPSRKGAYTVWGRMHEERKRNLGYRVDYILLAEPSTSRSGPAEEPSTASTPENLTEGNERGDQRSLLPQCQRCDIMVDFMGSDHAPVWLDLDLKLTQDTEVPACKLESRQRFKSQAPSPKHTLPAGGQRNLSSYFSSPPKKKAKGPPSSSQESTPPRRGN